MLFWWSMAGLCTPLRPIQRKRPNLIKTKDDLTSVLNILKANLEAEMKESDQVIFDRLLRQILRLNTVRVQAYLTHLTKDLVACVKACEGDVSEESEFKSIHLFPSSSRGVLISSDRQKQRQRVPETA